MITNNNGEIIDAPRLNHFNFEFFKVTFGIKNINGILIIVVLSSMQIPSIKYELNKSDTFNNMKKLMLYYEGITECFDLQLFINNDEL